MRISTMASGPFITGMLLSIKMETGGFGSVGGDATASPAGATVASATTSCPTFTLDSLDDWRRMTLMCEMIATASSPWAACDRREKRETCNRQGVRGHEEEASTGFRA